MIGTRWESLPFRHQTEYYIYLIDIFLSLLPHPHPPATYSPTLRKRKKKKKLSNVAHESIPFLTDVLCDFPGIDAYDLDPLT